MDSMREPRSVIRDVGRAAGLWLVSLSLLLGCGGGEDPAPAPSADSGGQGLVRRGSQEKQSRPKPPPRKPKSAQKAAPAASDPDDPLETFYIAEEGSNFDIVGYVEPGEELSVEPPQAGLDSTGYVVVDAPLVEPPGSPNAQFKLPEGFSVIAEAGYSQSGLPWRIRCEKDGALMALVPAGVSVMGTNAGPADVTPELAIYLDPYYIDVTEVTLERYQVFLDSLPGNRKGQMPINASDPPDHPALGITWNGASIYAKWAGKSLPTEAEWEKAARAEAGYEHPWGNQRAIWERFRTPDEITAVQSFRTDVSVYGVFDLAGNAREWCLDYFSDQGHADAATEARGSTLRHWQGVRRPSKDGFRVIKGNGPDWKSWHRWGADEREHSTDVGFRCVLRRPLPEMPDP